MEKSRQISRPISHVWTGKFNRNNSVEIGLNFCWAKHGYTDLESKLNCVYFQCFYGPGVCSPPSVLTCNDLPFYTRNVRYVNTPHKSREHVLLCDVTSVMSTSFFSFSLRRNTVWSAGSWYDADLRTSLAEGSGLDVVEVPLLVGLPVVVPHADRVSVVRAVSF